MIRTAHQLAEALLIGPDLPVLLSIDDQYGLVAHVDSVDRWECQLPEGIDAAGNMLDQNDRENAVVISPATRR